MPPASRHLQMKQSAPSTRPAPAASGRPALPRGATRSRSSTGTASSGRPPGAEARQSRAPSAGPNRASSAASVGAGAGREPAARRGGPAHSGTLIVPLSARSRRSLKWARAPAGRPELARVLSSLPCVPHSSSIASSRCPTTVLLVNHPVEESDQAPVRVVVATRRRRGRAARTGTAGSSMEDRPRTRRPSRRGRPALLLGPLRAGPTATRRPTDCAHRRVLPPWPPRRQPHPARAAGAPHHRGGAHAGEAPPAGRLDARALRPLGREVGPATAALIAAVLERRRHPQQAYRSCLGIP